MQKTYKMLPFLYILIIYIMGAIGLGLLVFYKSCIDEYLEVTKYISHRSAANVGRESPARYLVDSPSCKIPNLNPYDLSTSEFVRKVKHSESYSQPPLTETILNPKTGDFHLQIKRDSMQLYTKDDAVYCCISAIHQTHTKVKFSRCDFLSNTTWILNSKFPLMIVSCYDSSKSLIYRNLHASTMRPRRRKRRPEAKKTSRLNVLVLGLDSMSRLNLYRTLPQTVTYLHTHGWTELRGYVKIADNTLPNLMALLTGVPPDELRNPHHNFFDGYPFIWKEFTTAGYVTAYVEDNPSLGTFHCHLKGFSRRPTDYYPLNFFKLAEAYTKFMKGKQSSSWFKSSSDHLFSYLLDFTQTHRNDSFFGLFWVNDFSHNNLNKPSSEDFKVLNTLQKLEEQGTLNTTMVVFLSDHGLRVGDFRKTRIGWYEDRLPFLFVSVPEWYKTQNEKDYSNLLDNGDKLISPFDVYKTLSQVLHGKYLKSPVGCDTCHSLFAEIPSNRSCVDAGVSPHWCACHDLVELPVTHHSETKRRADLVVRAINGQIDREKDLEIGYICASLSLRKVLYHWQKLNSTEYVIGIQTDPGGAQLEATVVRRGGLETVEDSVSRLDEYGSQSLCTRNPSSKGICYCVDVGTN